MKIMRYLRSLWQLSKCYGEENIVYFDESGFEQHSYRQCGWAKRGENFYASAPGKREKRTNLIMARRGKQWIAPETFEGSCDSKRVNDWIKTKLFPALKKPSTIVFDNTSFHKEKDIELCVNNMGMLLCHTQNKKRVRKTKYTDH